MEKCVLKSSVVSIENKYCVPSSKYKHTFTMKKADQMISYLTSLWDIIKMMSILELDNLKYSY